MTRPKARSVLVLGGTGHLGTGIALALVERGHSVTVNGLRDEPRPAFDGKGITRLIQDDRDPAAFRSLIKGYSVVVDAATPYPLTRLLPDGSAGAMVRAATARARGLVRAVQATGARLVHISSFVTRNGESGLAGQVFGGLINGSHPYFAAKKNAEDIVRRGISSGLDGTIVQPPACFGPYDTKPQDQCFIPLLVNGSIPALTTRMINVIDVRDLGQLVATLVERGQVPEVVPVAGHNIRVDSFASLVCDQVGGRPPPLRVSSILGAAGSYWMETGLALVGRRTRWPSLPLLLLCASSAFTAEPVQTDLHVGLRSLDVTVRDALKWYDDIGHLNGVPR